MQAPNVLPAPELSPNLNITLSENTNPKTVKGNPRTNTIPPRTDDMNAKLRAHAMAQAITSMESHDYRRTEDYPITGAFGGGAGGLSSPLRVLVLDYANTHIHTQTDRQTHPCWLTTAHSTAMIHTHIPPG